MGGEVKKFYFLLAMATIFTGCSSQNIESFNLDRMVKISTINKIQKLAPLAEKNASLVQLKVETKQLDSFFNCENVGEVVLTAELTANSANNTMTINPVGLTNFGGHLCEGRRNFLVKAEPITVPGRVIAESEIDRNTRIGQLYLLAKSLPVGHLNSNLKILEIDENKTAWVKINSIKLQEQ